MHHNFTYPTIEIEKDVVLPSTRGLQIKLDADVDKIIGNHLDSFNRVFLDQGSRYQFASKADAFPAVDAGRVKVIGRPDHVLILSDNVLSFVEDKTPNHLPVKLVNCLTYLNYTKRIFLIKVAKLLVEILEEQMCRQ